MPRAIRSFIVACLLIVAVSLAVPRASAAVTVSTFTAQRQAAQVQIKWSTASEMNNVGFNVYRSTKNTKNRDTKINGSMIPTQCLGCITGASYSFDDTGAAAAQNYYYTLESVDASNGTALFGPASSDASSATATRTATTVSATATRTATRSPTAPGPSSTPTVAPTATNTPLPTATFLPGTPSPTRAPATPTLKPSATLAAPPSMTKVAMVVPAATATLAPRAPLLPVETRPAPTEEMQISDEFSSDTAEDESADYGVPQTDSSEPAPENTARRLVAVLSLGLAGLFAFASFISAALAVRVLVRASRR
ncbi:MAG: hypothetical protein HY782_07625 [Chloroflexi bacterium]|nr:hypothetical protein [Chloroflexota bacterium]